MTPNRLTFVNIKFVSLTVGVLLFHLLKIKRTELDCPVLYRYPFYLKTKFYQHQQVLLLYELLPKVQT